jgi:GNAT superfamily N-acetyltransferase
MDFRQGNLAEFEVRFSRMATAHAAEVGAFGAKRFLPAMKSYRALEEAGALRLFFAYQGGVPVGYQAFVVCHHPHYSTAKWAHADAVYVLPDHRGFGAAKFLDWADEQLKAEGVSAVMRASTTKLDLGPMFERMGYTEQETNYLKEL